MPGKAIFLRKLISSLAPKIKSLEVKNLKFEGSTPPGVFVGSFIAQKKVNVGPLLAFEKNSNIFDSPEDWIGNFDLENVIKFRISLLRGKRLINVKDVNNRFVLKLQESVLSKNSLAAKAEFEKPPRNFSLSEEHQPHGPSANIKNFEFEEQRWNKYLEKVYYDFDLKANEAITFLYEKKLSFSRIQKALSIGCFGLLKNRQLVPTRWSITATDSILGNKEISKVKNNGVIEEFRVYETNLFYNKFLVLLTPTQWQYAAGEAFINFFSRTHLFSDYENYFGRKNYSSMGGCYYAQRFAIAEFLRAKKEQAGAFVFREVFPGYVPTGVWLCREATKQALTKAPKIFENLDSALNYINSRLKIGLNKFYEKMHLLREIKNQKAYFVLFNASF